MGKIKARKIQRALVLASAAFMGASEAAVVVGDITSSTTWMVSSPLTASGGFINLFGQDVFFGVAGGDDVELGHDGSYNEFRRGSDSATISFGVGNNGGDVVTWRSTGGIYVNGAESSDDNYLILDYDSDGVFETLLRFDFTDAKAPKIIGYAYESNGANIQNGDDFATILDGALVPEPSSAILLGIGCAGLISRRSRTLLI